jgi:hypothetical protein
MALEDDIDTPPDAALGEPSLDEQQSTPPAGAKSKADAAPVFSTEHRQHQTIFFAQSSQAPFADQCLPSHLGCHERQSNQPH